MIVCPAGLLVICSPQAAGAGSAGCALINCSEYSGIPVTDNMPQTGFYGRACGQQFFGCYPAGHTVRLWFEALLRGSVPPRPR